MFRPGSHLRSGIFLASVFAATLAFSTASSASGGIGVYGAIEKVVFEPNEQAPQRLQVWGAFAFVDGGAASPGAVSTARRGFMYFALPTDATADTVKTEWKDLKSVAGTGQVVAFGAWGYIGRFDGLDPKTTSQMPPYILEMYPGRGVQTDLRVRPASENPARPTVYQTNVGVVKISADGSRREIVEELRRQLKTP